jgi:hypothetical protein
VDIYRGGVIVIGDDDKLVSQPRGNAKKMIAVSNLTGRLCDRKYEMILATAGPREEDDCRGTFKRK